MNEFDIKFKKKKAVDLISKVGNLTGASKLNNLNRFQMRAAASETIFQINEL